MACNGITLGGCECSCLLMPADSCAHLHPMDGYWQISISGDTLQAQGCPEIEYIKIFPVQSDRTSVDKTLLLCYALVHTIATVAEPHSMLLVKMEQLYLYCRSEVLINHPHDGRLVWSGTWAQDFTSDAHADSSFQSTNGVRSNI